MQPALRKAWTCVTLSLLSCSADETRLGRRCPPARPFCTSPDAGSPADEAGDVPTADSVWTPLSVMAIVDPRDHGAKGDGEADDLEPLATAVGSLPDAGGIVYLPAGSTFRKTDELVVTRSHVKFWAPGGQATLFQSIGGQKRRQSITCRQTEGCGFFGVKFTSDAAERFDALEDNHVAADHVRLVEVVGCDIGGGAAGGIFLYGSVEHYIEGNHVHHTWADHIHHTDGARESWLWGNHIFNESPSLGDNAVACTTYGHTSPRCGDMEWWNNAILGTGRGRGYVVLGGEDVSIHDNWAVGVPGAGITVASEAGYDSPGSERVFIRDNAVTRCGGPAGHPGILISGANPAAEPLRDITLADNVSVGNPHGAYRAEGAYANVESTGLSEAWADLPGAIPTPLAMRLADTTVLRTRDVSHVGAGFRPGLHRIHVRERPGGAFEQRFEYVVRAVTTDMDTFERVRRKAGDHLTERRDAGDVAHALFLTRAPVALPEGVSGVSFRDLRSGDVSRSLSWLWRRLDAGAY